MTDLKLLANARRIVIAGVLFLTVCSMTYGLAQTEPSLPPDTGPLPDAEAFGPLDSDAQALVDQARSADPSAAWAAIDALAARGLPPVVAGPIMPEFTQTERTRYMAAYLVAAGVQQGRGDLDKAVQCYAAVADLATDPSQACQAVAGLAALAPEKAIAYAVPLLDSEAVYKDVTRILTELEARSSNVQLFNAFREAPSTRRAALLRILAARGVPGVEYLLDTALKDPSPEVRVAAAQLANVMCRPADLLAVAKDGPPWDREEALRHYLAQAHAAWAGGQISEARQMFEGVATGPFDLKWREMAVKALEATGSSASLPVLERLFREKPVLAVKAARTYLAIASASGEDGAVEEALRVLAKETTDFETVKGVTDRMQALGFDVADIARANGFVTGWLVMGPFPDHEGQAFGKSFLPEAEAGHIRELRYDGETYGWSRVQAAGFPAEADLAQAFPSETEAAAYAMAQVVASKAGPALLAVGSDGGAEVWLNGDKIAAFSRPHPYVPGEGVTASLAAGANLLLIKSFHSKRDWRLCAQFLEPDGTPMDFSGQAFAPLGETSAAETPEDRSPQTTPPALSLPETF
jgi:hypothetical protein